MLGFSYKSIFLAFLVVALPALYSFYNAKYIMPSLAAARASNAALKLSEPVAVVVGGTAGIGAAMAVKMAQYSTSPEVHIVGRNETAAQAVITKMKDVNPGGRYEFHQCDLTSLAATRTLASTLRSKLPGISHLILSPGILSMKGRTETPEGNDIKMTLHYYSRFLIIRDLLPSLNAASGGSRIMTVLDSKRGSPKNIDWDELDLKKGYSLSAAAQHCMALNDMMVEKVAKGHSNITAIHSYPSMVDTDLFKGLNLPSIVSGPLGCVTKVLSNSAEDCAEWFFYALNAKTSNNARFIDNHGEDYTSKTLATSEQLEKAWEHSEAIVDKV